MEKNEGKARLVISDLLENIRDKLETNDHDLIFLLLKNAECLSVPLKSKPQSEH